MFCRCPFAKYLPGWCHQRAIEAIEWAPKGTTIAQGRCQRCFLSWRSLGGEIFGQEFYDSGCVIVLEAVHTAMVLWRSLGMASFIGADAMVQCHFSLFCSNSYVVKFIPYLVVVVTSLRELYPNCLMPSSRRQHLPSRPILLSLCTHYDHQLSTNELLQYLCIRSHHSIP